MDWNENCEVFYSKMLTLINDVKMLQECECCLWRIYDERNYSVIFYAHDLNVK